MIRISRRSDDDGSISLLISTLFLVLLIISFLIIDISGAYLAKRELLQTGEAAIQTAAHSVDLQRYFASDRVVDHYESTGAVVRVPIDCEIARQTFYAEISHETLRGEPISISDWNCVSDVIHATLASKVATPLRIPLLASVLGESISLAARVGATSLVRMG